jgi:hypothetical protein
MAIKLTKGTETVLYDDDTDMPFGVVFSTPEAAQEFIEWSEPVCDDLRTLSRLQFADLWLRWHDANDYPSARELAPLEP